MTIKEKLARETGMKIYLYKQGVFWVAYEQSALLLGLKKDLKPSFRFIKAVGREVLSVGFPESTRSFFCDIFGGFIETGKNTGCFNLNGQYDAMDLDARRKQLLEENAEKCHSQNKKRPDTLAEMIMAFRLAEKTPIDAMLFVKELQEIIRQDREYYRITSPDLFTKTSKKPSALKTEGELISKPPHMGG